MKKQIVIQLCFAFCLVAQGGCIQNKTIQKELSEDEDCDCRPRKPSFREIFRERQRKKELRKTLTQSHALLQKRYDSDDPLFRLYNKAFSNFSLSEIEEGSLRKTYELQDIQDYLLSPDSNDLKIRQYLETIENDADKLQAWINLLGEPMIIAETMPSFMGEDINVFSRWCNEHIQYPAEAIKNKTEGKVMIMFIVEFDGSLSRVTVLRGVDKYLDEEAVRVVKSSPKWMPGTNRGQPVRVFVQVPVIFTLK